MDLKGKTAIVTGASKGIGRSIAVELAKQGTQVVINYNSDKAGAEQTAQEITNLGQKALIVQADISNQQAVKKMVKLTKEKFSRIDILVNNAAVLPEKYLFRMSDQEWIDCMQVNINGTYFCTRHCLLQMLRQQYGKIINIVSISGITGNPGHTAYGASKAAIIGFTKSLSKEVVRKGININAVAPGYIKTAMSENFIKNNQQTLNQLIPAQRVGKPEEVAQLVVFLSSDKASYINGQVIVIDGGLTLK